MAEKRIDITIAAKNLAANGARLHALEVDAANKADTKPEGASRSSSLAAGLQINDRFIGLADRFRGQEADEGDRKAHGLLEKAVRELTAMRTADERRDRDRGVRSLRAESLTLADLSLN